MYNRMDKWLAILRKIKAFTLIELLVVMAIIATLVTIIAPRYLNSVDRAKEAVLRENLNVVRQSIDKNYGDTGKYPDKLETLVEKKYLREIPTDPITESKQTWQVIPPEDPEQGGVYDIKSGATGKSLANTPYNEW